METKGKDDKKGKQDEKLLAHGAPKNPMHQAAKLQGYMRNRGIKNIGHQQKKKSSRGDR